MNPNDYPAPIKGLFGIAGVFFVAALVVYGNTLSTQYVVEDVTTQGASVSWIINNIIPSALRNDIKSPYPSDDSCGHNGNKQDNNYVCVQFDEENIFATFSVNEKYNDNTGAGKWIKLSTGVDGKYRGWNVLSNTPQVKVNGKTIAPTNNQNKALQARAFALATFVKDNAGRGFSLMGDTYTRANSISDPPKGKNIDAIERGLIKLGESFYGGNGITVAAGVPLELEWQCQDYQIQLFGTWCNEGGAFADDDCTAGRKIDGFQSISAAANPPIIFEDDGRSLNNILDRYSSRPKPFKVFRTTDLQLRCTAPSNTGQKKVGLVVDGQWDPDAQVQWTMPARQSKLLSLDLTVKNAVEGHNITANPAVTTVGNSSNIIWYAEWAQRCRVTGAMKDGNATAWDYGSNCNVASTTPTAIFTAPGTYTYTLTYATFDTNGVETINSDDKVTVTVNCSAGQTNQGGTCVPDTNCPSGQHWNGTQCVPDVPPPTCGAGYHLEGGVCVPDTAPPAIPVVNEFKADPARVRRGGSTTLSWTGTDLPSTCTLSSTPAIAGFPGDYATPKDAGPIDQTTIFTLTCGSGTSAQRTVTVIPSFEEI